MQITTHNILPQKRSVFTDNDLGANENNYIYFNNDHNNKKRRLSNDEFKDSEYFPTINNNNNGGNFFDGIDLFTLEDKPEKYSSNFYDIDDHIATAVDKSQDENTSHQMLEILRKYNSLFQLAIPYNELTRNDHKKNLSEANIIKEIPEDNKMINKYSYIKLGIQQYPYFNSLAFDKLPKKVSFAKILDSMYNSELIKPAINCAIKLIENKNDLNKIERIIQDKKKIMNDYSVTISTPFVIKFLSLLHFIYAVVHAKESKKMRLFAQKKIFHEKKHSREKNFQFYEIIIKHCGTMDFPQTRLIT